MGIDYLSIFEIILVNDTQIIALLYIKGERERRERLFERGSCLIAELSHARSACSGAPRVKKSGYLCVHPFM